jgi:Fe-S cluster assembly iron-binding protein IscA
LEKSVDENDTVYENDGFKVLVSKEHDKLYTNLEIDFIDDKRGRGFTISTGKKCGEGCC